MTDTSVKPTPVKSTFIEAGGIEAIPLDRRKGRPWQLFTTWTAPNLEFATIFVGVIAVAFFGLGFWQAMAAIALGVAAGSVTQGALSIWGPRDGLAQLVLSRTGFGYRGNILPAALNTVLAGIGWFAVNSVSGAFALSTLTGLPTVVSLLIVVVLEVIVAFVGHDLVQLFERYASYILGVIFIVATVTVFLHANIGAPVKGGGFSFGGFTLAAGAAFGYAAGWNPYASDYSRYLPAKSSGKAIFWAAGLGNFVSCVVLMAAGAAAATIAGFNPGDPTNSFTAHMPTLIRDFTLVAIAVGAIAANALNVYSGAMSFLAAGIKIPFALRRALVALGFGVIGFFVAWSALPNAGQDYENFLLVISYWIAPWLGVVLVDRLIRRGTQIGVLVTEQAKYRNAAGIVSFVVAAVLSIWLFSNQTIYVGVIPKAFDNVGDLTAIVGFVIAGGLYLVLFKAFKITVGPPLTDAPQVVIGVDAADEIA